MRFIIVDIGLLIALLFGTIEQYKSRKQQREGKAKTNTTAKDNKDKATVVPFENS